MNTTDSFTPALSYGLVRAMLLTVGVNIRKPLEGPGHFIQYPKKGLVYMVWMDGDNLTNLTIQTVNHSNLLTFSYDGGDIITETYTRVKRAYRKGPKDNSLMRCLLIYYKMNDVIEAYLEEHM